MNAPLINIDILHNVIRYADLSTVLQLTKTCHEFNIECAQYLLREDVFLDGEQAVESFITFLTASGRRDYARRRLPFCTDVELSVGPNPSQHIKSALAGLFIRIRFEASQFTSLALHHSNALLAPDSPLPRAVAALTTLEELRLFGYGSCCAGMLSNMQSRLLAVRLARDVSTLGKPSLDDPPHNPFNDPLNLLHRSQETLKSMDVTLPITLRQGFCYPNLVELRICCPGWLPLTWTYICAFPRLTDLAFRFGGEFTQEHAPATFACSQWNIAEQHRLGTWSSLRRVRGSLEGLFLLGLTCAIPELTMDVFYVDFNTFEDVDLGRRTREVLAWRQILAYARPSHVTLHIVDSDWIADDHGFSLLRETPQLVSLRRLDLFVQVSYFMGSCPESLGHNDSALDLLWVIVPTFIKPIDLSVTFDWTGWSGRAREVAAVLPAEYAPSETDFPREKLEAVDMEDHVCRFVHEHTRSVRYSHVGPDGWRRETRCFGPNVSPEEQAAIVELEESEMEVD